MNPCMATVSRPARDAGVCAASRVVNIASQRPETTSNRRAGPVRSRTGVTSMITFTNRSAEPDPARGWRQQCSSTPITRTPSRRLGSSMSSCRPAVRTASLAECHEVPRLSANPGDQHAVDDHRLQCPQHRRPAQLRPCRRRTRAPTPRVPTATAPVAAHRDVQDYRSPPHRDVRQLPYDGVPWQAQLAPAGAPAGPLRHLVGLRDPEGEHGAVGSHVLTGDAQTQPVDQAERIKIRTVESRLSHVEVLQMGSVRTSIIGGPRPRPLHRRATTDCTLVCEEPAYPRWVCIHLHTVIKLLACRKLRGRADVCRSNGN